LHPYARRLTIHGMFEPATRPIFKPGIGKGILDPHGRDQLFDAALYLPCTALEPFVEHYWTVRWDRRGRPSHVQHTLPYPAVHVAFEPGRSGVVGVIRGRFERTLEGHGRVFGIKFHPAGFFPFYRRSLATLTDRRIPVDAIFGLDLAAFESTLFGQPEEVLMAGCLEAWLLAICPPVDEDALRLRALVEHVQADSNLAQVAQLAEVAGTTTRTLQRQFQRYVGVGPKWVIQRFRLQEAVEALARGDSLDQAGLAARLGYADQAHFVRSFRELVGTSPGAYARRARGEQGRP